MQRCAAWWLVLVSGHIASPCLALERRQAVSVGEKRSQAVSSVGPKSVREAPSRGGHGAAFDEFLRNAKLCGAHSPLAPRWLFVRGLHHSGTTLVQRVLALHPSIAPLTTGFKEDEGQHAQDVFPVVSERDPETCGADLCQCPAASELSDGAAEAAWETLCEEWLMHVTLTPTTSYVLEKTPDLMIPF